MMMTADATPPPPSRLSLPPSRFGKKQLKTALGRQEIAQDGSKYKVAAGICLMIKASWLAWAEN